MAVIQCVQKSLLDKENGLYESVTIEPFMLYDIDCRILEDRSNAELIEKYPPVHHVSIWVKDDMVYTRLRQHNPHTIGNKTINFNPNAYELDDKYADKVILKNFFIGDNALAWVCLYKFDELPKNKFKTVHPYPLHEIKRRVSLLDPLSKQIVLAIDWHNL